MGTSFIPWAIPWHTLSFGISRLAPTNVNLK
jgi:hypothetical protein